MMPHTHFHLLSLSKILYQQQRKPDCNGFQMTYPIKLDSGSVVRHRDEKHRAIETKVACRFHCHVQILERSQLCKLF